MSFPPWFIEVDQLHTSYLILVTLAGLVLAAGLLYAVGLLGGALRLLGVAVGGSIRAGFLVWERLLAWAAWPVFLAVVLGLLGAGAAVSRPAPGLAIVCGLAPLFMGLTATLAYMFIDLERYEVERGRKAVHNPLKGQGLAHHLVRYGQQVRFPLLAAAAVGVIGGFALLNQALFLGPGRGWYAVAEGEAAYVDFLAYALIHLLRVVDLLDLAGNYHFLQVAHVRPALWPASVLLSAFKTFFTLVLLQQVFASIRKGMLLAETIADFWSPHGPIHDRARNALPQFGAGAVGELLLALRALEALTREQRDQLPQVIAAIGPATVPVLVRHLDDPHEHVRVVAVAALGHLHARSALPLLVPLAQDPSDAVRQSVVEALGLIGGGRTETALSGYRPGGGLWRRALGWLLWWRPAAAAEGASGTGLAVTTLRAALSDRSAAVRTQAALALGRLGAAAAPAAAALLPLLHDADETVRCQAAETLAQVGGEATETVPALVALLQDPGAAVKTAAARALGTLKEAAAAAVPAPVPLLQDREELVRQAAAEAISQAGPLGEQSTQDLVDGLTSPDNIVRAQAAEGLGTIGATAGAAAPALVEALDNGSDRVRAKAVEALGKIGEAAAGVAVPGLVRALHDPDNWVSALAAEALGEMGASADEAVPALVRSLGDANAQVRGNAAEALGKMGAAAAAAVPALERVARDEDGGVRRQAVWALGEMGEPTPASAAVLRAALADADPEVRAAAVEALGKGGVADDAVQADLLRLLGDATDAVKLQVAQALPKLAGATPAVLDGLCRRLLEDDSVAVQAGAAQALGQLGPAAAAAGGPLLRAAQTGAVGVREQAVRALVLIQAPEAAEAFAAGLKDASADIRKMASGGWLKAAAVPEEALPALVDALGDPEVLVRTNAARVLARLDSVPDAAVPLLVECAAHPSDALRLSVVLALRAAAPSGARGDALRRLVEDPNERIRLVAAGCLLAEDPGNARAAAVVAEVLAAPTAAVRRAAVGLVEAVGAAGVAFLDVLRQRAEVEEAAEDRATLARVIGDLSAVSSQPSAGQKASPMDTELH